MTVKQNITICQLNPTSFFIVIPTKLSTDKKYLHFNIQNMKNWKFTALIAALMIAFSSVLSINNAKAQAYGQVSLDLFYNELSPYGQWDMDPNYGDVWYPDAGRDFRPYSSNGYWAMTEYGNTWVSNYEWGWAPFHYGRWVYTSYNRWGWIPGYEWGPAWVEWRSGNGYYGWAPMMPHRGVNISIHIPVSAWCFTPARYIYSHNFHRHAHYGRTNIYNRTTIINNTYVVNNNHYYGGPSRKEMERAIGRRVEVRSVRQSDRPGASRTDSRSVSIYRPDRDNNRTSNRSVTSSERRSAKTAREESRNNSRNTADRSAARSATHEMRIDNDGNSTIRNRDNRTQERAVDNRNTNSRTAVERGNTNTNTREPSPRTVERTPVERNNTNARENAARTRETATPRRENVQQQPQRAERPQAQRAERSQPQRVERAQPQREQRTQERSVRSSNPTSVSRGSSSRVERSTPASNNRSSGNTQRGGGSGNSERSRR